LHLLERRQLRQLGLERAWEAAAAEVPAVELLQEPGGAVVTQLSHRLAHEEEELGDDLLARRLAGTAVEDLAQRPGIALRSAADRLRHLLDRTAEVDVDEVRARVLDHARRLGHDRRIRPEDLDRQRMLVGGDAEIAERALVSVLQAGAADHLRADEPGPETAA